MLMADAVVTLITWLPFSLYFSIAPYNNSKSLAQFTEPQKLSVDVVLAGIELSNCFTSPKRAL